VEYRGRTADDDELDSSVDERFEESLEVSGLWLWHA
jgi:hypothetical protein